jgi:hypothetical protein
MVDEFKKVLTEFEAQNSPVCVLALLKMDDLIDKWSIFLAAPWINNENNRATFKSFLTAMEKNVSHENLHNIGRIGIFSNEEHLAEELMNFKEGAVLKDQKINGNMIYEGYVIASRPEVCQKES